MKKILLGLCAASALSLAVYQLQEPGLVASSHREAPLIANDPLADNTDVYAFRSPDDTNRITLIANWIPFENPDGGPNYHQFGENMRYEIHVKNSATTVGDDITYRFTFTRRNQDPTTFFNIRLGKENIRTRYKLERSIRGAAFVTVVDSGVVPPPNIGPRSIENNVVGLGANYNQLVTNAITVASSGERVFCGPIDDPFFVDLGAIFDLGAVRSATGVGTERARDGLANYNCHTICLQVPIATLQKDGKTAAQKVSILDPDYVIGVWASTSRPSVRTLSLEGGNPTVNPATYVQVSRLGMPLTNEAVTPIGGKDRWNAGSPYVRDTTFDNNLSNPELALYMDASQFGGAVPDFAPLRVQASSFTALGRVDFRNGKPGLFILKGNAALAGTALADAAFGNYLLQRNKPRSVDLLPIFHTGVPNLRPYQLNTGKAVGNPLTAGKPFIHNFLPTFGDMLRSEHGSAANPT